MNAFKPGAIEFTGEEPKRRASYMEDTPGSLYDDLITLEDEIERVGRNVKILSHEASTAAANYELLKNTYLLIMYEDESNPETETKKRTEAQREAMYRNRYYKERLARDLAKGDLSSERDLLGALKDKMSGMQSRKGIMMGEKEIHQRRT